MQGNHLFEYAVIRVVPKVEREEFLNVGVILYCKDKRFLQTLFSLDEARVLAFAPKIDLAEIHEYLCAIRNICLGNAAGGPIAKLDMASRFRWLTATRSTVVQASKVHPGLCNDPLETLERLHTQLVL
ncbi:MAG: DUF3037 domain-containing protein [Chitinophagaceae bacterium]